MLKGSGMERICPECSNNKIWSLKDGRFRCANCRKTFSDARRKIVEKHSAMLEGKLVYLRPN
jgi:protein-arginine kinase activator protein McsA